MTNLTEDLKPCPFCAAQPRIVNVGRDWWRLECDHTEACFMQNQGDTIVPQTDSYRMGLAEDWNRSIPASAPVKTLIEIVARLKETPIWDDLARLPNGGTFHAELDLLFKSVDGLASRPRDDVVAARVAALDEAAKIVMQAPLEERFGEHPYFVVDCKAMALSASSKILALKSASTTDKSAIAASPIGTVRVHNQGGSGEFTSIEWAAGRAPENGTVLYSGFAGSDMPLREALKLALEYWADKQQRYKNRHPVWVQKARAALQAPVAAEHPDTLRLNFIADWVVVEFPKGTTGTTIRELCDTGKVIIDAKIAEDEAQSAQAIDQLSTITIGDHVVTREEYAEFQAWQKLDEAGKAAYKAAHMQTNDGAAKS